MEEFRIAVSLLVLLIGFWLVFVRPQRQYCDPLDYLASPLPIYMTDFNYRPVQSFQALSCARCYLNPHLARTIIRRARKAGDQTQHLEFELLLPELLIHARRASYLQTATDIAALAFLLTFAASYVFQPVPTLISALFVLFVGTRLFQFLICYRTIRELVFKTSNAQGLPHTQTQSAICFGEFKPFVGSGKLSEQWAFALELREDQSIDKAEPTELFSKELLETRLTDALRDVFGSKTQLNLETYTTAHVPYDHNTNTSPLSNQFISVRILDELYHSICSFFIFVDQESNILYIELSCYVLHPMPPRVYQRLSFANRFHPLHFLAHFLLSLPTKLITATPFLLTQCAATLYDDLLRALRRIPAKELGPDQMAQPITIREILSGSEFVTSFDQMNFTKRFRVIEKKLLSSMRDVLQSFGLTTEELEKRENAILNEGIMIIGSGTLNANAVAAGSKSMAQNRQGSRRFR